jgi:hypothetical protein
MITAAVDLRGELATFRPFVGRNKDIQPMGTSSASADSLPAYKGCSATPRVLSVLMIIACDPSILFPVFLATASSSLLMKKKERPRAMQLIVKGDEFYVSNQQACRCHLSRKTVCGVECHWQSGVVNI